MKLLVFLAVSFVCTVSLETVCEEGDESCVVNPDCPEKFPNCTSCEDVDKSCKAYEKDGDCHRSPGWMVKNCGKSCKNCHLQDWHSRCQWLFKRSLKKKSFENGKINPFFESLVKKIQGMDYNQFEVTILHKDPWVLQIDNFFTDLEAFQILQNAPAYEPSKV